MINRVSFEGIGEVAATFQAENTVKAGDLVKLKGNGTVAACTDGERFCGVAISAKTGCAAVQLGGFVEAKLSGSAVTPGYVKLVADGKGGVKKDEGQTGLEYLVVEADTGAVTFMM